MSLIDREAIVCRCFVGNVISISTRKQGAPIFGYISTTQPAKVAPFAHALSYVEVNSTIEGQAIMTVG